MPVSTSPTSRPSLARRSAGLAADLAADTRILLSLLRGLPRRSPHAEALARFYGPQADRYDDFRERLLQGRAELIRKLPAGPGDHLVELGGGTGRTLEFFGPRLQTFAAVDLVDLCQPLLDVASKRLSGLPHVRVVNADASTYQPAGPVDCVYLSYALTMMPPWRAVIDNVAAMLRPGGTIGVVDFYVSPTHGWLTRTLWPAWFQHDGVHLSADHLPYLQQRFESRDVSECRARVPYLPMVTAPYYLFIGRKQ